MNDGFQFIDIIFFAAVAAFLVLRLRSVLGRRTGHERPPPELAAPTRDSGDNVVELPRRNGDIGMAAVAGTPQEAGLLSIRQADPGFAPASFLEGARAAFAMIVGAYAQGDKAALRPLLSDQVFANFSAAIDARRAAGETLETEVIHIRKAEIVEARMDGRNAVVTVRFASDQVNVVSDSQGRVVEGDPNRVAPVTDVWTFARNTQSRDPNWQLVETGAHED